MASAVVELGKLVRKRYVQYSHSKSRLNWDEVRKSMAEKITFAASVYQENKKVKVFL